jgi:hypothetical protein
MTATILPAGAYGAQNLALAGTLIVSRDALVAPVLGTAIIAIGFTDIQGQWSRAVPGIECYGCFRK